MISASHIEITLPIHLNIYHIGMCNNSACLSLSKINTVTCISFSDFVGDGPLFTLD